MEGFYKDFTLLGLSGAALSIIEVEATCKVCILTALKLARQIFYHDLIKLYLETFFFKLGPELVSIGSRMLLQFSEKKYLKSSN